MEAFIRSLSPLWIALVGISIEILLVAALTWATTRRSGREAVHQPWAVWCFLWILRSTALLVLLLLAGIVLDGDFRELPGKTESLTLGQLQSLVWEAHAAVGRLQEVLFALLLFGALQVVLLGRIIPVPRRQAPVPSPD